jgi:Tol biopolymer transport system component
VRAALSNTGALVYALGTARTQVVMADMQGETSILVEEPRNYSTPRYSPDGSRLVFGIAEDGRSDIWIHDLRSGTSSRLTSDGTANVYPDWHPDGKRVLFGSNRDGGRNHLWLQNADLSGTPEVLERGSRAGVFSPIDPNIIASVRGTDIFYSNAGVDTVRRPISSTSANEFAPRFSPDGNWIAYAATGEGDVQVYVQPFPPTGARYKVTDTGGMTPIWSRDQKRIFFVWAGALHAATVRTGSDFAVTKREKLFGGGFVIMTPPRASYDVSRDGNHFLLLRQVDRGEQLVVAHDWKHELRERVRLTQAR